MTEPLLQRVVCGFFLGLMLSSGSVVVYGQGIPEPPVVLYGTVTNKSSGARLTIGTLSLTLVPIGGGTPVVVNTILTNIDDQFSFILYVPCESPIGLQTVSANTLKLVTPNVSYVRTNLTWNGIPLVLKNSAQGTFTMNPFARGLVERMDLDLGVLPPDTDGNGLPDAWEMQYFHHLGVDPNIDADGDGLSNRKEYVAGTDPTDKNSSFEFVDVTKESSGIIVVKWSSVPGKSYTILRSPTLSTNPLDYQMVQSGIASQGSVTSYRDTTVNGTYFYRVRVVE